MYYEEVYGDLLKENMSEFFLCHTVSVDCAMGAGIARTIVSRFPGVRSYCKSLDPSIGDVILFEGVYNLFTKKNFWNKPTLSSVEKSLVTLRNTMVASQQAKVAMPLIGCGLDKLAWRDVSAIIKEVFQDTDIHVRVYHYQVK